MVLCHLAEGKPVQTAAEALGVVYRTVEYFVVQMQKRLDCLTTKDLLEHPVIEAYLKNADR